MVHIDIYREAMAEIELLKDENSRLRKTLKTIRTHYEFGVSEEKASSNVWWRKLTKLITEE